MAAAVSSFFLQDGALQARHYLDWPANQGGYAPVNPPLNVVAGRPLALDVNRWQPLLITNGVSQNGIPVPTTQAFLGSQWLGVRPFALARAGCGSFSDEKPLVRSSQYHRNEPIPMW